MMGNMEGHKCNPEMNQKFDEYFYKLISEENMNKFGCTVPYHRPMNFSKTRKVSKICDNVTQGIQAWTHYDETRSSSWPHQFTPCARFDISMGLPFIDTTGNSMEEAYIKIYMLPEIKVKSIVLYYDSTTLVSQIGGCVGILLGVSIVDIVKTFNSLLIALVHKVFK